MKSFKIDEIEKNLQHEIESQVALFESVIEDVRVEFFEDKEFIINANTPLNKLFLFISGKAKISILHEDGHRSIVYFVKPNEMIGELSLIGIEKHTKDVIAIGPCICLSVSMDIAKETLLKDADFLLMLNKYIGGKLLDRTWFNAKQQHYELKHRLAAYILLCETGGIYNEKHTETTEYLAVSYRHLLHTFKNFNEEGLIIKSDKGYRINRDKLEILASVLE
jgi:CRP-like cAMP-binding protein